MPLLDIILDHVFNYFSLKFGRREIYNENIYSELHTEIITTFVTNYFSDDCNNINSCDDGCNKNRVNNDLDLIEFTELKSTHNYNYNYDEIEKLAFHLSIQIQILEKRGFTLLYLQSCDILRVRINNSNGDMVDGSDGSDGNNGFYIYLLADLTQLVPLDKQDYNKLVLIYPKVYPLPEGFCAPELYNISILPFITHRSAVYYSIGLLCLHLFKNHNYIHNLSLNHLKDTPLFYFLERCLKEDPLERMCLFI